jgi:AcrR family transcriptional regulator
VPASTRQRILDHAERVASRDGLDGLTVGRLAAELGMSKSGLFAHIGSKEALQLEVLRRAADRFRDVVVRPAGRAERGEPRLRAYFDAWLRWAADPAMPGGCLITPASFELDDRPGPARDFLAEAQRQWLRTLAHAARVAIDAGHFHADVDAEQVAFEVNGVYLGYLFAARLLGDEAADRRARAAFERLVRSSRP